MGGEWREEPLCQLFDFSSGLSKPRADFGSGFPFLSFKQVFKGFFVPRSLDELVQSTERERERCSIRKGDVFLTRTSETMHELGMSCVAFCDLPDATFNGFTKRLRPKPGVELDPAYCAYYFRSPHFRRQVTAMSSPSTRASLNNEMLSRITMLVPPPPDQRRIGAALKSLDDKIELNRRMSETLEAMARALFKSWFVDFDPVRAKLEGRWRRGESLPGLPAHLYNLFPDRLVDSELGEIPEGWGVRSLDDVAEFTNGAACQRYPPDPSAASLPVIKIRELNDGISDDSDRVSLDVPDKHIADDGSVLFSWSGTLICKIWTGGRVFVNQHVFKATSEEYPTWFFFHWTLHHLERFRRIAADKATTMGHIKRRHLNEAIILSPSQDLLGRMADVLSPLIDRKVAAQVEAKQLEKVRNSLLSPLISGELDALS